MDRKTLIALLVAVTAAPIVCGHASAATPQTSGDTGQEATAELDAARNAWLDCVRAAIPRLDHPESTSEAVARAAMSGCSGQYTDLVRALSRTLVPTCGRDADCTRTALAKAEREATRTATEEVVTARIRVAGAQVLICQ